MNARRGYVPDDDRNFSPEAILTMRTASKHIRYLIDDGYDLKSASTFVGNHFLLSERQRLAIVRSLATEKELRERNKKRRDITDMARQAVWIDGFNEIIMSGIETDNKLRCPGDYQKDPLYLKYHDEEWGRPCHDERMLYEMFVIELFQAGLSWRTLLHKRENFRKAYDNFDLNKVAGYGEEKIAELMQNTGIIRSLPKIRGSITNSRIIRDQIIPEYGSFDAYVWHFTGGRSIYEEPGTTKDQYSDAMAADLKNRGAKYAGSVSLFSYLQSVGVINSHTKDCFCYREIVAGEM